MSRFVHPELLEGEVWLTNVFPMLDGLERTDSFRAIRWRTKRRGNTAYDANGSPVPGAYPVFVMEAELAESSALDARELYQE